MYLLHLRGQRLASDDTPPIRNRKDGEAENGKDDKSEQYNKTAIHQTEAQNNGVRVLSGNQISGEFYLFSSTGNELGFSDQWVEQISYRALPPPTLVVNFPMVNFSKENGAIRQIPCTQRLQAPIPSLEEEPPWMKNCLIYAPAGSALIRDIRCWHGGTANNSDRTRPMTSVQYYAPWFRQHLSKKLPRRHFERMSLRAQHLCRYIVED